MRRLAVKTLSLGMVLVLAGACTSDPESTIEVPSTADGADQVKGGEIIVSGDLSAGAAAADDASDTSVQPPAAGTSEPTSTPPTTTRTSTSPPASTTTRAPRSTASGTDTTNTSTVATTEAPVIGDGPVLTAPKGIADSGESPGVGTGLKPVFFALEATTTVACNVAKPGTVRVRWEVIGVETVDVSVGSTGNIRSADEPPAGSIDLPLDCTTGSQYFVIAENPDGETIRSVSVSAD